MVIGNENSTFNEESELEMENVEGQNSILFYCTVVIVGLATLISLLAVLVSIFILKKNYLKRSQNSSTRLSSSRRKVMGNDYDEDSSYVNPRTLCKGPPPPNFDKLSPYTLPLPIPSEDLLPQAQKIVEDGFFTLNSNHNSHRFSSLFNPTNIQQNRFSSQFVLVNNENSRKETNEKESFSKTTITPNELEKISTDSIRTYSIEESEDESESGSYNKLFQKSQKKCLTNLSHHVYEEIQSPQKPASKRRYPYL